MKNKATGYKPLAPSMRCFRSAISNGSRILAKDIDGRSAWSRRLRDLIADHTADLGGEANVSEAERRLIRRAAMLSLQLEMQEQRWASDADGEASAKQLETYQRASNSLRRILESLGLRRRQRDITPPSLEAYSRQLEAAAAK
jgi:hypothetical protein